MVVDIPNAPNAFSPDAQPEVVAYLEYLLDRARAGEVQFLVASAGVTPAGEPTGFEVKAYAAIGSRIPRLLPQYRMAAYGTTLEGLASAACELERGMEPHRPKILG